MKISVLIGSRNRPDVLKRCLESVAMQTYTDMEIVVLDDASSPPLDRILIEKRGGNHPIRCIRADKQLGLAGVRNRLLTEAQGDLFFIIDDDAYFEAKTALTGVALAFSSDPKLGILATKILDYRGGNMRPLTPHSRKHLRKDYSLIERPHLISYFLGGGHAIRRSVIESCGLFDEVFMYGQDELELAYRVLDSGYHIFYLPEIVIHHKPPEREKGKKSETSWRLFYLTRNRILFAYKHLPLRYTLPYTVSWLGWYGIRALQTGLFLAYLRGIGSGLKTLSKLQRQPIKQETVAYLKAHYGRLWR